MGCDAKYEEDDEEKFYLHEFPRYNKVVRYLRSLQKKYPKLVKLESIGYTIKGRDIYAVKLSQGPCPEKWMVLIDACIHAREWITVTSALCVIDHILATPMLLYMFDYYIIPCLNPDGYEFSHTKDRLWRKNLNPNGSCCVECQGVDLNRNFPCAFGKAGSSNRKNSETYRGECPLSEPESRALARLLRRHRDCIKLYISLHTFGNCIMYPWGYKCDPLCDQEILKRCGLKAKRAMDKCNSRSYKVGSIAKKMYVNSGNTSDYARREHDIQFVYTIELQKGHETGFTIGTEKIPGVGADVAVGVETMSRYVYDYFEQQCSCKDEPPCKRRKTCP